MKWTDEQISQLKELCYEGVVNREIAEVIGCDVADVYNKRSQLRITIAKCKGIEIRQDFEDLFQQVERGLHKDIRNDFATLNNTILVTIAQNRTSLREANIYSALSQILIGLEIAFDGMLKDGA